MSNRSIARLGFWSAIAAFGTSAGYGVVQLMQIAGALAFPADEILIFAFSLGIPVPFVLALVALHHSVPATDGHRVWTHAATLLGTMYAVLALAVYGMQLGAVVPAKIAAFPGTAAGLEMLTVTPGSAVWAIDGAGYLLMGLATLFAAFAITPPASSATEDGGPARLMLRDRWLRGLLIANGLLDPLIVAIYIFPGLLMAGSLWLITAPGSMLLLAFHFRARMRGAATAGSGGSVDQA